MKKVSFSKLKKIYENSLKIRILEETISREYKKNKDIIEGICNKNYFIAFVS